MSASGSAKVMTSVDYFPLKVCPYGPYATRINKAIFSYPIVKGVSVSTMSSMHSAKCHLRVLVSETSRRHGDRKRGKDAAEWHSQHGMFSFCFIGATRDGFTNRTFHPKNRFFLRWYSPQDSSRLSTSLSSRLAGLDGNNFLCVNAAFGEFKLLSI